MMFDTEKDFFLNFANDKLAKRVKCEEIELHGFKPSLSMKILYINNFTTKLLSKLLSDLSIGVHLKSSL